MIAARIPTQQRQPAAIALGHIAKLFSNKLAALQVVLLVEKYVIALTLAITDQPHTHSAEELLLRHIGHSCWFLHAQSKTNPKENVPQILS